MSRAQPSASQQIKRRRGKGGSGGRPSGSVVNVYLHAVTDGQATLLTDTATTRPLWEVENSSGARVMMDSKASPVPGMKVVVITGHPSQIHTAVGLISHKTGAEGTLPDQAQTFWLQWVEAAFPHLDSRAYFLPPVYVNRVPMTRQSAAGQEVLVLQSASGQAGQSVTTPSAAVQTCLPQPPLVQDSDVRDDAAMQRVLFCLKEVAEQKGEVLIGMSQLQFGQYLGEPCYAAAAAQLALPATLPSTQPRNWKRGDFDVLLIHRHYGFVVCEVKTFGDNVHALNMSPQVIEDKIREKLKEAATQLDKAAAMLSHLVSDVTPGVNITKVIAVPNLKADQVKQALSGHKQLTQDLCLCLGTSDPTDITGLCLCCDQLSDPKTPCDVSSHVLRELGHWWQRRVTGAGPDIHMTDAGYRTLVARFCGPATTVTVPCTSPPRVSVKTLGQAVWWTGQCYTAVITLFPEQLHLLNTAPPRLFLAGPPGTGKTVVLLMMGIKWLLDGHPVYIVSTWWGSRAASIMLYHLLLQTINTQQSAGVSPGQPHLLQYEFVDNEDEKAVNDLSHAASGGSLYVIADEVASTDNNTTDLPRDILKICDLWLSGCGQVFGEACGKFDNLHRGLDPLQFACKPLDRWCGPCGLPQRREQSLSQYLACLRELEDWFDNSFLEINVEKTEEMAFGRAHKFKLRCNRNPCFPLFCDKLLTRVPRLHLWAASYYHGDAPAGWQVEYLTRPLRSPPAVVREVEKDERITVVRRVHPYRERGVPDHTDGPPVTRLYHRGEGHSGEWTGDCVTCCREVASFLHSLRVGVTGSGTTTSTTVTSTSSGTTPPCIQWRDVLVLYWSDDRDKSVIVKGLQEAGIPVRVMKDDDIEDVVTARSDVVWVASGHGVRGLERKVVVCLQDPLLDSTQSSFGDRDVPGIYIHKTSRLDRMSRCTSQLVIVSPYEDD